MTLRDDFARVARGLADEARRVWSETRPNDNRALAEIFRPELGPTPEPLRRLLEPVVAVAALTALGALGGVGAAALAVLLLAGALAYLIITYVFGVELGLNVPGRPG